MLNRPTTLRDAASADAAVIAKLAAGTRFAMLDNSRGWAWGYAGDEHRVGYVPSKAVGSG